MNTRNAKQLNAWTGQPYGDLAQKSMSSEFIHVLTVQSNEESRRALDLLLSQMKGVMLSAHADSQSQALQILQEKSIDLVLLEFSHTDDVALTKSIRKTYPQVRLLIFTASDTPEDIFAAMDAGADGYVLKGNLNRVLEIAIRSVKLGTVWLDPGIAQQVLRAIEMSIDKPEDTRVLPTGLMPIPLMPDEKSLLHDVAGSNCVDGVCMVDPSFLKKLKRFSPRD